MLAQENRFGYDVDSPVDIDAWDKDYVETPLAAGEEIPFEHIVAVKLPLKSGKYQITDRNDVTVWSGEHYKSKNFTGGHTMSCGEWHRIRIEYSIDDTTCLAKVYLDGTPLEGEELDKNAKNAGHRFH